MLLEKSRGAIRTLDHSLGALELALAVGVTYFLAARLGLALRPYSGVAAFWPAAGIAVGILLVLGPNARIPVAAGVVVATAAANLSVGRHGGLAIAFGFNNAVHALCTVWLLERWFGGTFRLGDVRQVLGFLVASAAGSAIAAVGAAISITIVHSAASPLNVWRIWFAACLLGIVTVAPLIITAPQAVRAPPPRRESIEGIAGLVALAGLSAFLLSLPDGTWAAALPEVSHFPTPAMDRHPLSPGFCRWRSVHRGPGDHWVDDLWHWALWQSRSSSSRSRSSGSDLCAGRGNPRAASRRLVRRALKASAERVQFALDGARLGAFSADFTTGRIELDARATHLHGHEVPPGTIRESRRFVHPDDLVRIDAAVLEARRTDGAWRAEYRVMDFLGPRAREMRWVALEGSIVFDGQGKPVGLRGVTHDITDRKRSEQALAERDTQLALAGKVALVGCLHLRP